MHAKVRILPPQPIFKNTGVFVKNENLMVFTGNANKDLAKKVASNLGLKLGEATVGNFSDGETMLELLENVRGKDVFILQSTSFPTNDNLMEIMVMVDALRRSSAARITAAIPILATHDKIEGQDRPELLLLQR